MDEERRAETLAWIAKAEDDLAVARLVHDRRGPATVGCFLCQQVMEKLLKAALVVAGEVPPKTHDLARLHRRLAESGGDLGLDPVKLVAWTPYAVAARYPGFGDPTAEADLPAMLAAATTLAARVRALAGP